MKRFEEMTAPEIYEESLRRKARAAAGLPLHETPAELERIREEEDGRLEKEIQQAVRKIYLAHGCDVHTLSQPRASKQTPGIGDLYVVHVRLGAAWWHETKTPSGKQSPDQEHFESLHHALPVDYVLGGEQAAWAHLRKIGAAHGG